MALRDNFTRNVEKFIKHTSLNISLQMPTEKGKQLLFESKDGFLFCPAFATPSSYCCGGVSVLVSIPKEVTELEASTLLSLFARESYSNIHKLKTKEGTCYVGSGIIMDEDFNILVLGGSVIKYDQTEQTWYLTEGKVVIDQSVFDLNKSKVHRFIAKEFMAAIAWKAHQGIFERMSGGVAHVNISIAIENIRKYELYSNVPYILPTLKTDVKQCLLNYLESN